MSGAYAIHFQRTIELFDPFRCTCGDAGWAEEGDMITLICWACPDCPPKALISKQKVLKRKVTHYISRRLKVTEKEKIRIRGKSKRKIRDDPRQRSSRKRE
ncbi:hypothetical protein GW17_00057716 [Ensete ventricosum]|nr:hypothetical protein GW17_00057716 [Ensete ventricosum]